MAIINHCFCCFSLRSGMLLLGWSQAILSVLSLCGVIVEDSASPSSSLHQLLGSSLRTLYVLLGGSVIQTIASGFLLFGVYRKNAAYVLEYVKLETLLHIASLLEFILYIILEHSTFSSQEIYIFLGFLSVNYGLTAYYLLAAYSYYQTITQDIYTPLIQP